MNPFLSEKAEYSPGWHKPVFFLMLFLTGLNLYISGEFFVEGDYSTAVVGLGLTALCAWPTVHIAKRWICGNHARPIAEAFLRITDESVPLKRLYGDLHMRRAEKWLSYLLEKRYLLNAYIDRQKNAVVFTAANPRVARTEYVHMECPFCGGPNRLARGRTGRCEYCGSALTPVQPADREKPKQTEDKNKKSARIRS